MLTASSKYSWYRDTLCLARLLVIANLVFLMFSPPLTNVAEGLLYLLVLASGPVRRSVFAAARQPLVVMSLVFAVCLIIGSMYGPAPRAEALSMLTGWRRLLLLPVAMGLFGDLRWKTRALWVFILVTDLAALVSYGLLITHRQILHMDPAISVRNHSTQSMMFSVAAFSAAMLLKQADNLTRFKKYMLLASIVALVLNAVAVLDGRSGYLVLAVCGMAFALSYLPAWRLTPKHLAVVLLPVVVVCLAVAALPVPRHQIELGVHEARHYQDSTVLTSIGIRMIFYKNTLSIVVKHPFVGVGTGGFRAAYEQQVAGVKGWESTSTTDPHNQFLKILAEQGIVGLAIFLLFIASAFWQRVPEPFRILGLGVLCSWCATSLFNSHFSTFSEGRFIFVWCGIMFATLPMAASAGTKGRPV